MAHIWRVHGVSKYGTHRRCATRSVVIHATLLFASSLLPLSSISHPLSFLVAVPPRRVHLCLPQFLAWPVEFGDCRQSIEWATWWSLMDRIKDSRLTLLSCLFLAAATLAAFWPVIHYDFVNCDDQPYVYGHPAPQMGPGGQGVVWAFAAGYAGNWHPLTWLSHLLDMKRSGLNPGAHHLTSQMLHVANPL